MRHAYAYDTGSRLMSEFGFTGLPSAILLDASGVVRWTGHPGALQKEDIEAALAGALPIPMWEWPKAATGVRKALQKQEYQAALNAALALEDGQTFVDAVRGAIAGRLASLEAKLAAGDFLGASALASNLKRAFKGLPELQRATEISDKIKGDPAAQELIVAQKEVAKVREELAELKKKKEAEKLLDRLLKVQEKHPGTYASDQASKLAEEIQKLRSKLK